MPRKISTKNEAVHQSDFTRIIDIGNGVNTIDKVSTLLHAMFKNPKIIMISKSLNGKFKKKIKRGFFEIPSFNIPISYVKNFDELKNDYDFICLALKK